MSVRTDNSAVIATLQRERDEAVAVLQGLIDFYQVVRFDAQGIEIKLFADPQHQHLTAGSQSPPTRGQAYALWSKALTLTEKPG